ncbi:hypothetical protein MKW94_007360 [Papaver nudicaule]|uniref:DYW domain-containing protein n=1 Tax=Papaver nudicaule TaxID=74823 RepID=A0AA42ARG8_PAPNU|nr:hypothetical protein [Papaver nudicaule]
MSALVKSSAKKRCKIHISRLISNFHTNIQIVQQLQNTNNLNSLVSNHTIVLKSGFSNDTFISNHLINSYIRLHKTEDAHRVFDEMSDRNVVTWTALMSGYINIRQPKSALKLFEQMPRSIIFPNPFTFATAINACSYLSDIGTGRKTHSHIVVSGFHSNLVVCTSLINMYGKSNYVDDSRRVFDSMENKNVVSWTSMISVYAQNARGEEALLLFREYINSKSYEPNQFLLSSVINACASLAKLVTGKVTHSAVIRHGYDTNEVVASSLIDMYAKCGLFDYSLKIFRRIPNPGLIPYTSVIVGAAKYGLGRFSLDLFEEMLEKGIRPNDVTFLGVLHACSHSGLIDTGLQYLNSMYETHGIIPDSKHYICAVDMLGRTGRLDEACQLAKFVPPEVKDIEILWGSLLSSSRTYGRLDIAVEAGERLIEMNQHLATAYVTMSNTSASVGNWENAYRLRSEMNKSGINKEPGSSWVELRDKVYVFYAGNVKSCARGDEVVNLLKELEVRMKERGYVRGRKGLVFVDVEDEVEEMVLGLHSEKLALGFGLLSIPEGAAIRVIKNLRMCLDCHEFFKAISKIVERDIIVRDVNRFHHFIDGSCTCNDFW